MDGWTEIERTGEMEFRTALRSQRLRRLLIEVWECLPLVDRLKINDALMLVSDASVLTVIMDDNGAGVENWRGCAIPTQNGRRFIYLSAARLKNLDDDFAAYVIAHELAHVFHRHDGGNERTKQRHEKQADATAARWGYPREIKLTFKMKTTRQRRMERRRVVLERVNRSISQ